MISSAPAATSWSTIVDPMVPASAGYQAALSCYHNVPSMIRRVSMESDTAQFPSVPPPLVVQVAHDGRPDERLEVGHDGRPDSAAQLQAR